MRPVVVFFLLKNGFDPILAAGKHSIPFFPTYLNTKTPKCNNNESLCENKKVQSRLLTYPAAGQSYLGQQKAKPFGINLISLSLAINSPNQFHKMKSNNYLPLLFLLFATSLFSQSNLQQSLSVNGTGVAADPSAQLDVSATDKGMLVPRMTTAQRNAITAPATGLLVFDTDTGGFWSYGGSTWAAIEADNLGDHTAGQNLQLDGHWLSGDGDGEGIWVTPEGRVAIGDNNTTNRFEVLVDSAFTSEVADQSVPATGDPLTITSTTSGAQTLLTGLSGLLSKVEISARIGAAAANLQLEIRSGSDPAAGSVLATVDFDVTSTTFATVSIELPSPVAVAANDPLVIVVRKLGGGDVEWERSASDVYPGGNAFVDASGWIPLASKDHWLATYVEQPASATASRLAVSEGGGVGIGTGTPDASAALDIRSTTKGLLIPRMTNAQITAIAAPAQGLQVYSLDDGCLHLYDGSKWLMDCALAFSGGTLPPSGEALAGQLNDFPAGFDGRGYGVAFTLGGVAYVGTGYNGSSRKKDLWKYDEATDIWTQLNDFPAGFDARVAAVAFTLGGVAYVGTGGSITNKKDLWKYDPGTDTWTQLNDFPAGFDARFRAVAFTLGSVAYVGTGNANGNLKNDLWKYDPGTDTWMQLNDFPAGFGIRDRAVAFTLGGAAYVGTGSNIGGNGGYKKDLWKYDVATDAWTQLNDFPAGFDGRGYGVAFTLDDAAYVGTGNGGSLQDDLWEYDPATDSWTATSGFPAGFGAREGAVAFALGGVAYVGTGYTGGYEKDLWKYEPIDLPYQLTVNANGEAEWVPAPQMGDLDFDGSPLPAPNGDVHAVPLNDFPEGRRDAVAFTLGGVAYIGTGSSFASYYNDLWKYHSGTDNWTQLNDFPAGFDARFAAVAFTLDGVAYVGTGFSGSYKKDLWKYDPATDNWTQLNNFPAGFDARAAPVAFTLGGVAYVGTGYGGSYKKDLWKYDAATDNWTQLNGFPAGFDARSVAVAFTLDGVAYIGTGASSSGDKKDLWKYHSGTDIWTQLNDFPAGFDVRRDAVAFTLGGVAYVGTGYGGSYKKDLWKYDAAADNWIQLNGFPAGFDARSEAVAFTLDGVAYVGTGYNGSDIKKDLWKYDPQNAPYQLTVNSNGEAQWVAPNSILENEIGNVGIGRIPLTNALEVEGNASKSTAGSWLANSDARLKTNIHPLDSEDILQKMLSLRGITYEWDDDVTGSQRPEGTMYGFTAQNIQKVFPELVEEDNLGFLQTAYGTYDAMTVEAIRALVDRISGLDYKVEELEAENSALQFQLSEMAQLKQRMAMLETALLQLTSSEKREGED